MNVRPAAAPVVSAFETLLSWVAIGRQQCRLGLSGPIGTRPATLAAALALGVLVSPARAAALTAGTRVPSTPPTIVAHIDDYAQVPAGQFLELRKIVTRIYADAGVRLLWQGGSAALSARADAAAGNTGALHLDVIILSDEMSAHAQESEDVLGRADGVSRRIYIFHRRILDYAAATGALATPVLAYVLAHEIGHVVLPGGHAPDGLMQASLRGPVFILPAFTKAQAQALQSRMEKGAAGAVTTPPPTPGPAPAGAGPTETSRPVGD